ncbi:MAG: ComF family protein [Elusimicrobiota bacterium]
MLGEIIDFFLPPCCVICKKVLNRNCNYNKLLCGTCYENIVPVSSSYCRFCGKPLEKPGETYCVFCRNVHEKRWVDYIRAAGVYDGVLKRLIHDFKYSGKDYLGSVLAGYVVKQLRDGYDWDKVDALIPVPLYLWNYLRRGYNQTEVLAKEIGKLVNVKVVKGKVRRSRLTRSQVGLTREERIKNLEDAFTVRTGYFRGKVVVIIDDVCTTSTTINQCAKAVNSIGGAKAVYGITVAHGE